MLKGIPSILSPELLKVLCEMGHGDEIVIGDGNFPAASNAQRLIRCDGHNVPELLDAILQLFPLDTYVESPVMLMQTTTSSTQTTVVSVTRFIQFQKVRSSSVQTSSSTLTLLSAVTSLTRVRSTVFSQTIGMTSCTILHSVRSTTFL